jgi:hypothetical protein
MPYPNRGYQQAPQAQGPGIWPLRPAWTRQTNDLPMPDAPAAASMERAVPPPADFRELPSGFNPFGPATPGRASYEGPPLNTRDALAGLINAPAAPEVQRAGLGAQLSYGDRPQDRAFGQQILQDVESSLAPQRERLGIIGSAMTGQHPAVRSLQEAEARRKAMPAMATSEGVIEAADISAEQRGQQAMLEAITERLKAEGQQYGPTVGALSDIVTGPGTGAAERRNREWAMQELARLLQLGQ